MKRRLLKFSLLNALLTVAIFVMGQNVVGTGGLMASVVTWSISVTLLIAVGIPFGMYLNGICSWVEELQKNKSK